MRNNIDRLKRRGNGKVIAGFILICFGALLLLQQFAGLLFPWWLFQWPVLLILGGLFSGARNNFSKPTPYLLIGIGVLFLLDDIFPGANFSNFFWPVIIIAIGTMMILGRNNRWVRNGFKKESVINSQHQQWEWDKKVSPDDPIPPLPDYTSSSYSKSSFGESGEDYLTATSIFGSANKTILSKNFKGGEIINIFGGAEIDFTQADITGRVVIDITQIFGGVKLLVPPHWHVTSDIVALFAGFDDKRKQKMEISPDKVLVISGASIFAGIEVRSY